MKANPHKEARWFLSSFSEEKAGEIFLFF